MALKRISSAPAALLQMTCAAALAATLAGCSSDASRFADNFGGRTDPTPTASIPSAESVGSRPLNNWASAPSAAAIESRPLPAPGAIAARPMSQPSFAAAGPPPKTQSYGAWSGEGGATVTVSSGESLSVLSNRYGVPEDAFLHVNGLSSSSDVRPGSRIVVPVYGAARAAPKAAAAPAPASAPVAHLRPGAATNGAQREAVRDGKMSFVRGPDGKPGSGRFFAGGKPPASSHVASEETAKPKVEAKKLDPKPKTAEAAPAAPPKVAPEPKRQAAVEPAKPVADAAPPSAADTPEFRWPAHGRVIQGFKSGSNDGINIALPEGTSVKAAEGGVVAYAGSELKGYGNLVLIRHPNGYTSAYANNGEIAVKRGDTIKRGQVIAKSGQTGNVASPQLHFELRKGSTPVDPSSYLAGT